MERLRRARQMRQQYEASLNAVQQMVRVDEILPEKLAEIKGMYPEYERNKDYEVGDVFQYMDGLYKVIQDHTSLDNWLPSENPALYTPIMPESVIPMFVQPTGAHDAYPLGQLVIYKDDVWESLINDNVWSPDDYAASWFLRESRHVVEEPPVEEPPVEEPPVEEPPVEEPPVTYPAFVQPTGGHDAYNIGDKVSFEGANWESVINANTWSPTAYAAG